MLYATTRNQNDVYTVHKAIHTDCAPDGGLYVPFKLPVWDREQLKALAGNTFGQNVAQVLNDFFSCGLSAWDVEFAIGRSPVRLSHVNHRVVVAELFHNPEGKFQRMVQTLSDKLRKEDIGEPASNWVQIAVAIAALFGIYGEYLQADMDLLDTPVDIAVTTGSFRMPVAAWYARQMGLPVGNIVCGCNANGAVWDLLHKGEMPTGNTAVATIAPEADIALPRDLERLICATLGVKETARYLQCCATGSLYEIVPEELEQLRSGIFAAVISDQRIRSLILSVYRNSRYIFGPYSILAYGSLMDYRAKTGESRTAILVCERSPLCDSQLVADAMDISVPELKKKLSLT